LSLLFLVNKYFLSFLQYILMPAAIQIFLNRLLKFILGKQEEIFVKSI